MSAIRKLIRQHVIGLLKGNTSAGTRVYPNRQHAVMEDEVRPLIIVHTNSEEWERKAVSPPRWRRLLTVVIEAEVKAKGHPNMAPPGSTPALVDDLLDDFMEEIEAILFSQKIEWGLEQIQSLEGDGVQIEISKAGEAQLLANGMIAFEVGYDITMAPPTGTLAPFKTLHVDHHLSEPGDALGDEQVDAVDDIVLPQ